MSRNAQLGREARRHWLWLPQPVLVFVLVFLLDGRDAVWAFPVALAAVWLAYEVVGPDVEILIVSSAVAALFVSSWQVAMATASVLGLVALAARLKAWWILPAGMLALFIPGPDSQWVAVPIVALLVAWPAGAGGLGHRYGPVGAGVVLAGVAFVVAEPAWAGVAGLAAGLVARTAVASPANLRVGRMVFRASVLGALAPAAALLLFAALARGPVVSPVGAALAGFGVVGLGLLVLAYGFGAELALRASGPGAAIFLAGGLAALAAAGPAALLGGLGGVIGVASMVWPLLAVPIAAGILVASRQGGVAPWASRIGWSAAVAAAAGLRVVQ